MVTLAIIDTDTMYCNYRDCSKNKDGKCSKRKFRDGCIELALQFLCLDEGIDFKREGGLFKRV